MNSESSQEPRTPQSKRGGNLVAIAAVAIVAVILALPLFVYGPNPESHDVFQHVAFAHHFNQQFWAGELYPRWIPALNHGLGSPTFFVYPPLPSYVFALLDPVARVLHVGTFTIGQFLTLILSGVFAFLWLRTLAGAPVAAVGAMLYMMAPYHLKANFYQREALAECWAMV